MLRHFLVPVSDGGGAAAAMPVRVAAFTIKDTTFKDIVIAEHIEVFWQVLRQLVVPAEQRAHFANGDDVPAALVKIEVWFYWIGRVNASILGPLISDYPALVRSLRVLKIARNVYDESAALGAFAALATDLRELTFRECGLTSVQGLEGRCEYLHEVNLWGCKHLTSIDALADRVYLEEVYVSSLDITSIEPLRSCPNLKTVGLFSCRQLSSIDALAGHQWLQEVNAIGSGITSIEPLRTCPALNKVYLGACKKLPADIRLPASVTAQDSSPDEERTDQVLDVDHPQADRDDDDHREPCTPAVESIVMPLGIVRITIQGTDHAGMASGERCAAVLWRTLNLYVNLYGHNHRDSGMSKADNKNNDKDKDNLTGKNRENASSSSLPQPPPSGGGALLALDIKFMQNFVHQPGAPVLGPLIANYSALVRPLRVLNITWNTIDESEDLAGLAAVATNLRQLSFVRCGLTSVRGLERRSGVVQGLGELNKLDLSGSWKLESLVGLENHARLTEINLAHSAVKSVRELLKCPALTKLNLTACQRIRHKIAFPASVTVIQE